MRGDFARRLRRRRQQGGGHRAAVELWSLLQEEHYIAVSHGGLHLESIGKKLVQGYSRLVHHQWCHHKQDFRGMCRNCQIPDHRLRPLEEIRILSRRNGWNANRGGYFQRVRLGRPGIA